MGQECFGSIFPFFLLHSDTKTQFSVGDLAILLHVSTSKNLQIKGIRNNSQENNLLNNYSAKMALRLFGKTWWRFSSYSIVYRGR
jgi:hypothetical protein